MGWHLVATDPRDGGKVVAELDLDNEDDVRRYRRTYTEEFLDVAVTETS